MKSIGTYGVWLKGSRKTIRRAIYTDGETFYIKWYGQMIEVIRGTYEYVTVEEY